MSKTFHIAAIAGAGTGKTYSLVENYLFALFGLDQTGVRKRPHEILALTFTKKAAHEMRLRIVATLSQNLEEKNLTHPLWQALNDADRMPDKNEVKRLLRSLSHAPIDTFHGFCQDLIRKECAALDTDGNFSILSESQERELANNVLRPILFEALFRKDRTIKSLVARFRLSNGLLAKGLIESILRLYQKLSEEGEDLNNIFLNFDKRNLDIAENKLNLVKSALEAFSLSATSKSTKDRLQKISEYFFGLKEVLSSQDEGLISKAFYKIREAVSGNFGCHSLRGNLVLAVEQLGALLVDRFVASDEKAILEILVQFHDQFELRKKQEFVFSYADLLLKTKHLLLHNLEIRRKIKLRFAHILVDEYQDTNPVQEDIIALILENKNYSQEFVPNQRIIAQADFSSGASLFVVGDKKQSIYGFRGASVELFDRMIDKLEGSDQTSSSFTKRFLTTNRRSKKRVIELVNLVSSFSLKTQGYLSEHRLLPLSEKDEGRVSLWVNHDDANNDKTTSNLLCAAHGVKKLLNDRIDLEPKDVVVLTRRIYGASIIKGELQKLAVPCRIVGGEGFYEQQEIVDLICALRLINNPKDEFASAVVLRSPLILVRDSELLKIKGTDGLSFLSAQKALSLGLLSEKTSERLTKFINALKKIESSLFLENLSYAIDRLMTDCDFAYAIGFFEDADQKRANVEKLQNILRGEKIQPNVLIDEMYQRIFENPKEALARGTVDENAVTIMTIHQSKGLEFKVVVVADTEAATPTVSDDLLYNKKLGLVVRPRGRPISLCLPRDRKKNDAFTRYDQVKDDLQLNEEREQARLLYVALTRAKEELYVSASWAGFSAKEAKGAMLGIFLEPYHCEKAKFLSICSIEIIHQQEKATLKKPILDCALTAFSQNNTAVRWFASNLLASPNSKLNQLIDKNIQANIWPIDGNLAHGLISQAISCAAHLSLFKDKVITERILMAALRSQNFNKDYQASVKASLVTLRMLAENSDGVINAMSEVALASFVRPDVVVEGFADLVICHNDFIGVIEFKSSKKKVTDVNTYFQVLSYAHALEERFLSPVIFAVHLIGSSAPIRWCDYNKALKEQLSFEISYMLGHIPPPEPVLCEAHPLEFS